MSFTWQGGTKSQTHINNYELSLQESSQLYLHDNRNTDVGPNGRDLDEIRLATSDMFTRKEIDAITLLQITAYLTPPEREEIGTRTLCAELLRRGREGAQHKSDYSGVLRTYDVCDVCRMPMLEDVEKQCVICPELKRGVLRKILKGYFACR